MGWFDESGKNYSNISKPSGYGSGSGTPAEDLKFNAREQKRARDLLATGHTREEALVIILKSRAKF